MIVKMLNKVKQQQRMKENGKKNTCKLTLLTKQETNK